MVPEGWDITKLSDLADVKRGAGSQYLTYVDEPDEGIRLIRIGDFLGDNAKLVSHTSDMDRFILKKDDILIAGTGATAGITFEVPAHFEGYAFSYNAPRIRPKRHVDKVFLVNFLKSNEITKQQRRLFTGNAQPFLDTKAIGGFKIWTPPLPEQRKIADILSTWDAAIEKTEALLATARAQKRALMQSLLTGKRRFPEFESQPWKEVRLGELGSFKKGKGLPKTEVGSVGKFQCVLYGELYTTYGEIIDQPKSRTDLNDGIVSVAGDVLIPASTTTSGIDLAIASCVMTDGVRLGGDINIFRCKSDTISGAFLAYFLAHARRHEMARFAQGVTIIHLKGSDLLDISISVPPKAEQAKILAVVRGVEDQIAAYRGNLAKLRTEKKALMQQLLTGKRRVVV